MVVVFVYCGCVTHSGRTPRAWRRAPAPPGAGRCGPPPTGSASSRGRSGARPAGAGGAASDR